MADVWKTLKEWPELRLERLEDAGVARILLNRPDKRNCWNRPMCLAFIESLDIIRADQEIKCCITKGAGPVFSSGLDLNFLREVSNGPLLDWDRPNLTIQIAETVRNFPRIMIAQVHGYCLGGALGIMNCHDLVYAADDCQIGMPEMMRGSFGQLVTSTLLHGGIPVKKLAHIAIIGRNLSGKEADELGIVSANRCRRPSSRASRSDFAARSRRVTWRRCSITRSLPSSAAISASARRSRSTSSSASACAAPWTRSTTSRAI